MRTTAIAGVALTVLALSAAAQESQPSTDATQLKPVIAALNDALRRSDAKQFASLFAPNGDLWILGKMAGTGPQAIEGAFQRPHIWSETTPPQIQNESVRFLSSDVALVDAVRVRYGSTILKESVPVTMLLKYEGGAWRIATMRINPICALISPTAQVSK